MSGLPLYATEWAATITLTQTGWASTITLTEWATTITLTEWATTITLTEWATTITLNEWGVGFFFFLFFFVAAPRAFPTKGYLSYSGTVSWRSPWPCVGPFIGPTGRIAELGDDHPKMFCHRFPYGIGCETALLSYNCAKGLATHACM
jgi:hypothetical protein